MESNLFFGTLVVIQILVMLWAGIGFIRTAWVSRERIKLIDRVHEQVVREIEANAAHGVLKWRYNPNKRWDELLGEYLSYDEMMKIRYWLIWDLEKLKNKKKGNEIWN